MSVLVLSAGRSGTNIALEILANHSYFIPTEPPEDKWIFDRWNCVYPDTYLSKSDTCYCRSCILLRNILVYNPSMKIVWTIRHPYDMVLSKINRGCKSKSDDATFEGCIADMYKMFDLYKRVTAEFPDRVYTIRMEDVLLDTVDQIKKLCEWLEIGYEDNMQYFYKNMRHAEKRERYTSIDLSQINMWLGDSDYFNIVCNKSGIDVEEMLCIFRLISPITMYFKYYPYGSNYDILDNRKS